MRSGALLLLLAAQLPAQLILSGPIPKTANPPVVFINGYQNSCGGPFSDTFFSADKVLQAQGIVSLFFDNCSVPNKPSIEVEGAALGQFIAGLKYMDGASVPQVDVIAHSMGGLIVRAYLAGMQEGPPATFKPPVDPKIRRIIFIATPHFGSTVAGLGSDKQTMELLPGSQFLFDLNSWNQGSDDLRGVAALSIVGNGGTGAESFAGFDDGVATLTSSSISFYRPGVTRVLPYCHTSSFLLVLGGLCASSTPALTQINTDAGNLVSQSIVSFLTGTDAWKSIGQSIEANMIASITAGLNVQLRDRNDQPQKVTGAFVDVQPRPINLPANGSGIAYSEAVPAGTSPVQASGGGGLAATRPVKLPAGTATAAVVKPGPVIFPKGVIPAVTQLPFPYDVAPGQFVAIYGDGLAGSTTPQGQPYPTQVGDLQVLVNGMPAPIQFSSNGQINIVYPNVPVGLSRLTVKNSAGEETINVRVAPAVPAIFQLSDNGAAAAVDVTTSQIVTEAAPLRAGDFMSLYLTGLGITDTINNLEYARVQPTITVGGKACEVSYAGRAPSFAGLDQINCKVPSGVSGPATPVVVTVSGRTAPTVTVNVQ